MKRILIVDDVTTNLKCATEVLKDSYEVTTAKSGKAALLILKEMVPDVILLDINMPEMSGFEVMEKLRENSQTRDIPVVFLTAETDRENEEKGLLLGARDFIRKPFEPEMMKERLDRILQSAEENGSGSEEEETDRLTNLLSRKHMEKLLSQESEMRVGVFLLLNLDNFKRVNDTFGEVIGDEVLIKFAGVMKEEVSDRDVLCRINGDEFAVFIPGEHDKKEIRSIARRMIAGIEFEINDLIADSCDFKLSVSIGIARKPEDAEDFEELYLAADKALYYVKQSGKRGYYFYHGEEEKTHEAEEDSLIDLLQLKRLVQEREPGQSGAYQVEYDGFKRIYRFVSRCMERKSQDVQLVLFTIQEAEGSGGGGAGRFIDILEKAVSKSLRRGDVATQCGSAQYVAILMNASEKNGELVVERIRRKFTELAEGMGVGLTYEMMSVGKKEE